MEGVDGEGWTLRPPQGWDLRFHMLPWVSSPWGLVRRSSWQVLEFAWDNGVNGEMIYTRVPSSLRYGFNLGRIPQATTPTNQIQCEGYGACDSTVGACSATTYVSNLPCMLLGARGSL